MVAGSVAIQPASVVCGSRVFPRAGVLYSAGGPTSSDFSSLAALNQRANAMRRGCGRGRVESATVVGCRTWRPCPDAPGP